MSKLVETLKSVAQWAGPATSLVAIYTVVAGVPSLPAAALLVGGGFVASWLVPKLVKLIRKKLDKG